MCVCVCLTSQTVFLSYLTIVQTMQAPGKINRCEYCRRPAVSFQANRPPAPLHLNRQSSSTANLATQSRLEASAPRAPSAPSATRPDTVRQVRAGLSRVAAHVARGRCRANLQSRAAPFQRQRQSRPPPPSTGRQLSGAGQRPALPSALRLRRPSPCSANSALLSRRTAGPVPGLLLSVDFVPHEPQHTDHPVGLLMKQARL
jgi:hypothetical protein